MGKWHPRLSRFIPLTALIAVICAMVALPAPAVAAAAAGEPAEVTFYDTPFPYDYEHIGGDTAEYGINFWHYSGGFWKDGEKRVTITDKDYKFWENPERYYDRPGMSINARVILPAKVREYLNSGAADSGRRLGMSVTPVHRDAVNTAHRVTYSIDGDYITIHAKPLFVIDEETTYRYYVPELKEIIPIVKEGYGWNTYSMYSRGYTRVGVLGSPTPFRSAEGTVEFTDILDVHGHLRPGKRQLMIDPYSEGKLIPAMSDDINIGSGTFNSAGAVGMWFQYLFEINFYLERTGDLEITAIDSVGRLNAGSQTTCVVAVRNNRNIPYTGENAALLSLSDGIHTTEVSVEIGAGETKDVSVPWKAPTPEELKKSAAEDPEGGIVLPIDGSRLVDAKLTAVINPDRHIEETDYENNTMVRDVLIGLPVGTGAEPAPTPAPIPETPAALTDYSVVGFRGDGYPAGSLVESYVRLRRDGAGGDASGGPEPGGRRTVSVAFFDGVTTRRRGVELLPGEETEIAFQWFTQREPGTVTLSAHINPERVIAEADYTNNKLECVAAVEWPPADLAVADVSPSEYPAGLRAGTVVRVRNTGGRDFSGVHRVSVRLSVPAAGFERTVEVNIDKNTELAVPFMWTVPPDTADFTLTAEVNPTRAIEETDYSNNALTLDVFAGTDTNREWEDCVEWRTWDEERFSHYESNTTKDADGNTVTTETAVYVTRHFYAEVSLAATLNPGTVKSGYGVECEVRTGVDTNYDSFAGVCGIQEVYAYLPQSGYTEAIKLENVPGETDLWRFPVNPSSVTGARVQYIPVDWPDGETFEIRFMGVHGQCPGGELSASASATALVSGNMYEDDYTAPTY